jgi:hypothetical protein
LIANHGDLFWGEPRVLSLNSLVSHSPDATTHRALGE